MNCIILAGGTPSPESPLYPFTKGLPKALLLVNGRPMIQHVLTALQEAHQVETILIVGLTSEQFDAQAENVFQIGDQGSLVQNGLVGLRWMKKHQQSDDHVLMCSADVPLLNGRIVDAVIANCQPFSYGLYYHFVTRTVMEKTFPNSERTFVKLKKQEIAGADAMIVKTTFADSHHDLYQALTNGRKQAWKLARIVGLWFLLKFMLRQTTIKEIERTASAILKQPIKIMLTSYAELGMDVDKPAHLDMIQPYVK